MMPFRAACHELCCLSPGRLRTQSYEHMQLRSPRRLRSQHSAPSTLPDGVLKSWSQAESQIIVHFLPLLTLLTHTL